MLATLERRTAEPPTFGALAMANTCPAAKLAAAGGTFPPVDGDVERALMCLVIECAAAVENVARINKQVVDLATLRGILRVAY